MRNSEINVFDVTIQKSKLWVREVMDELKLQDSHKALLALKAALHALRDRLSPAEVAQLGAQLPGIIRGVYYEDWRPAGKPSRERHKEEFLAHIKWYFAQDARLDPETVACAVFRVLDRHITEGESVRQLLPAELRMLWPPRPEEIITQGAQGAQAL